MCVPEPALGIGSWAEPFLKTGLGEGALMACPHPVPAPNGKLSMLWLSRDFQYQAIDAVGFSWQEIGAENP